MNAYLLVSLLKLLKVDSFSHLISHVLKFFVSCLNYNLMSKNNHFVHLVYIALTEDPDEYTISVKVQRHKRRI